MPIRNESQAMRSTGLRAFDDAQMMTLAEAKRVHPAHEISARRERPRDFAAAGVDVGLGHGRQLGASALTGAFVAEFQAVQTPRCCGSKKASGAHPAGSARSRSRASRHWATFRSMSPSSGP